MSAPRYLLFLRHGESEGNIANALARNGDFSAFTSSYMNSAGSGWKLTQRGLAQSNLIGSWIREEMSRVALEVQPYSFRASFFVSPYLRAKQTAAALRIASPDNPMLWHVERALRELDCGDIEALPQHIYETEAQYARNALRKISDPLYWRPPGGESAAEAAEQRIPKYLERLSRECSNHFVLSVTHGQLMRVARMVIEHESDEEYVAGAQEPSRNVKNCQLIEYRRAYDAINFTEVRTITPVLEEHKTIVSPWSPISPQTTIGEEELFATTIGEKYDQ